MKRFLMFVVAFLPCLYMLGQTVDKHTAMNRAKAFLVSLHAERQMNGKAKAAYKIPALKEADETTAYYVFNADAGKGFVIVSGDDRTEEILGYADSGVFDPANIPPGMQDLLEQYKNEIKLLDKLPKETVKAAKAARKAPILTKVSIAPLLTTMWNQDSPYCDLCPMDGTERSVTGCVATALAQVMAYHRWPASSTQPIESYTTSTKGINVEELPVTSFDWDAMLPTYTASSESTAKEAVAKLMQYCGSAVRMDYSAQSSGAVLQYSQNAVRKYFGYDDGARYVSRASYTVAEWNNMMYEEIKAHRPVFYGAQSSTAGGHAFVLDGYKAGNFFHVNWGWGGVSNGYFRLSVLYPSIGGIGGNATVYSVDADALIGVCPPGNLPVAQPLLTAYALTTPQATYSRRGESDSFAGFTYRLTVGFAGGTAEFQYGVGLMVDGVLQPLTQNGGTAQYTPGVHWTYTVPFGTFGRGLKPGNYKLIPICRPADSQDWYPCVGSEKAYLSLDITETTLTVVATKQYHVTGYNVKGSLLPANDVELIFDVDNTGDDIYETWYLDMPGNNTVTVTSGGISNQYHRRIGAEVAAREQGTVSFFAKLPQTAGAYPFTLRDKDFKEIYSGNLNVQAANEANIKATAIRPIVNAGNVFYGRQLKVVGTFSNEGTAKASGQATAILFKRRGETNYADQVGIQILPISLDANEQKELTFVFNQVETNTSYLVQVIRGGSYQQAGWIYGKPGIGLYPSVGDPVYANPSVTTTVGDAAAVDMRDMEQEHINRTMAGSNPNCVYYLPAMADIPGSLASCNVVRGSEAETITLTDAADNSLRVPFAFMARSISYTRHCSIGLNGVSNKGWQTLCLPFTVSEVTVDGVSKDWFHDRKDKDKDFWVMAFKAEDGKKVYFAHTPVIEAHTPYIFAVPATNRDKWDDSFVLTGKDIVFKGTNVMLKQEYVPMVMGENYYLVGSYTGETVAGSLGLDAQGSKFVSTQNSVTPFHAYYEPQDSGSAHGAKALAISVWADDPTLGIRETMDNVAEESPVYNINGMKMASNAKLLPKGVYIVNGRKVVR